MMETTFGDEINAQVLPQVYYLIDDWIDSGQLPTTGVEASPRAYLYQKFIYRTTA